MNKLPMFTTDDYHDFIQWLQDHGWVKANPCINCSHWQALPGGYDGRCKYHKIKTWADDYCGDSVYIIKEEEETR